MRSALLVTWLVLVGCGPPPRPPLAECGPSVAPPPLPGCASCRPIVERRIREPDFRRAIDVAFLLDGFRRDELPDARRQVDAWIEVLEAEPQSVLARGRGLINYHFVDVSGLAPPDGRLLGACAAPSDTPADGRSFARVDRSRVMALVGPMRDLDVVVVVLNASGLRENAELPLTPRPTVALVTVDSGVGVLAHELGHALLDLQDEYTDLDRALPRGDWLAVTDPELAALDATTFFAPNLTIDPAAPKFGPQGRQAAQGGARLARGLYHPGGPCLMGDLPLGLDLCPVCDRAAREAIAARTSNDAPTRCAAVVGQAPDGFLARAVAFDWDGLERVDALLDGHPVQAPAVGENTVGYDGYLELHHLPAGHHALAITCVDTNQHTERAQLELDVP